MGEAEGDNNDIKHCYNNGNINNNNNNYFNFGNKTNNNINHENNAYDFGFVKLL